jgi:ferredoxin
VIVGFGFVVCQFDPYIAFFQYGGVLSVLIFGIVTLILGFIVGRPFCRFLCPYGALLGMCSSLSARKTAITPGQCDQCKLCEHVCPYNAILLPQPEPTPQERRFGPMKLAIAVLMLPIIVMAFALLGRAVAPRFATLHRDVQTAELLYIEEEKWVETSGTFPETRGLIQIGKSSDEVYQEALKTYRLFQTAGFGLGIWVGLVIGIKWITLSLRRQRKDYEVDPARCFACGRCYWYCPNQKEQRLLLIEP